MRRNDPCPCGGGRRYKHCCGAGAEAQEAGAISVPGGARRIRDLSAAGRYPEAAALAPAGLCGPEPR